MRNQSRRRSQERRRLTPTTNNGPADLQSRGRFLARGGFMTLTIEASGRSLARAGRVLAVPLLPGAARVQVGAGAEALTALEIDARAAINRDKATGEAGEIVSIQVGRHGVETVLLVGVGDESPGALRKAAAAV